MSQPSNWTSFCYRVFHSPPVLMSVWPQYPYQVEILPLWTYKLRELTWMRSSASLLFTSNSDCYLSFPETVLNDTNGNRVVEIICTEAVLVANFAADILHSTSTGIFFCFWLWWRLHHPKLLWIDKYCIIPSHWIRLQSIPRSLTLYTLTNVIFSHENSDTITVNFTAADLNSVKTEAGLCE